MILPSEICVLITYDEYYTEIFNAVHPNISNYCKLHGYSLITHKQENITNGRSSQWQKIKISENILKENNYKWLFFMDVDCLIMNPTIKLETIIDDDYSFIVPAHNMIPVDTPIKNPIGTDCVITSQFFVKNNKIGIEILEDIWEAKEWPVGLDINTFDYEQRQVKITIDKPIFKEHVKVVEEKTLNCFWYMNSPFMVIKNKLINNHCWEPGDFIVHVTGYKKDERIKLLNDLNYFSGGLLSNWECNNNVITFSPLIDLGKTKIIIYDENNNPLINYNFNDLNYKINYILYIDTSLNNQKLIIKGFDGDGKLISIKMLHT
jgi:hypothetical protein